MARRKDYTNIILIIFAIALVVGLILFNPKPQVPSSTELKKFTSYDELTKFIKDNIAISPYYTGLSTTRDMNGLPMAEATSGIASKSSIDTAEYYSSTNIQVAGVDEPDFVKNDGKYIYMISGTNVLILDAYPAENAKILSQINFTSGSVNEIFVNDDKLVVFGYDYGYNYGGILKESLIMPRYYNPSTFIQVYDISDRENPVLKRNVSISGSYFDSRMIGNDVYVITNQQVYSDNIPLPMVMENGVTRTINAPDIYYFDYPDYSYTFTNIVSFDVQNDAKQAETEVFLTSYTQNMYVSKDNIYLTYNKRLKQGYFFDKLVSDVFIPSVSNKVGNEITKIKNSDKSNYEKMNEILQAIQDYTENLDAKESSTVLKNIQDRMNKLQEEMWKESQKTVVHRIAIDNGKVEYKAEGEVTGSVDSQFSMDEYNGYFRIATTTEQQWNMPSQQSQNNLYVLGMNMKQVGKIEGLASGERIYSARFIGDRAYMVTFKRIDPLFVIDLSNPASPAVLGQLKITGFSDYLHPYDATHLIGIGQEANETTGRTEGLKVALFDVSDVSSPKEISKYVFEQGSYSEALYDHKAFLFDKSKNLLVIPVSIYRWNYTEPYKDNSFYGAYVFDVSLSGIQARGTVSHDVNETMKWYSSIRRSLYMDNVLYTVSSAMVQMNALNTLQEINKIELPLNYDNWVYAI